MRDDGFEAGGLVHRLNEPADPVAAPTRAVSAATAGPSLRPPTERRSGGDRRLQETRWYDSLLGHRRRRRGRRHGESRNVYVDVYHAGDLLLIGVVFVLNVLDAVLTLRVLARGGVEHNPLMQELIEWGPGWFLAEKGLIVGVCLVTLLVHKNFPVARRAAYVLLSFYGLLMLQHLSLL